MFLNRVLRAAAGLAIAFLLGVSAHAEPARTPASAGPLVSVAWLQQQLASDSVTLIDASSARLHAKMRIPTVQSADVYVFAMAGDTTQADVAALSQRLSLRTDRAVVIYDQGGDIVATSLYFDLLSHGFAADKLHLLDGGLSKWRESGLDVVQTAPEPPPAAPAGSKRDNAFVPSAAKASLHTDLAEFLTASGDTGKQSLVEGLEPEYYFGARSFFERGGHVPNAKLWSSQDLFNADKTFKSPNELARMATHLGLDRSTTIHTYCGGGVAASAPWFALKVLLNYPDVKLFKGSEIAYQRDSRNLPVWTYPSPHLLRDATYASTWTSPMLRARAAGQVSLLDIRPAQEFAQGHPSGALSWPVAAWRDTMAQPAELAKTVAAAGLNAKHEAIIVSKGGINRDSALAYVALRSLGHRTVSLLSPSVDDWALSGQTLDKPKPTGSTGNGNSYQVAQGVSPYAMAASSPDLPRQYIAASETVATVLPLGMKREQVVHVPLSALVQSNGAPRPAKDIWATLHKAGVSRYSELVTFAANPADAAIALLVLELMGFAKVAMLAPS